MLTDAGDAVDGDSGDWFTRADLARIKKVSRQAISKRWNPLKESGKISIRVVDGKEKVRLAEWDAVTGEETEPARLLSVEEAPPSGENQPEPAPADPGYSRERTRQARYDADLKEIRLRKEMGELIEVAAVSDAMARCAEQIVRDLEQLPIHADDLAAAMSREGVPGLRKALKNVSRSMRTTLEQNMRLLAEAGDDDDEEGAAS